MSYKVKLQVFEGPLDLLLYLIKKEEIDIYDIPIAAITEQYLEYLEFMRLLDLDIAAEFIVMAATLMHIKSKMLLPADETIEAEEEELDPRAELVRRLLEYKKFKEAASTLGQLEIKEKDVFRRQVVINVDHSDEQPFFEASLFDLISAFSKILKEVPKDAFYQVIKDSVTVEERVHDILHMLVERSPLYFTELFKDSRSKVEIIATFLAILELVKVKEILAVQRIQFGEIEVVRNFRNMTTAKVEDNG